MFSCLKPPAFKNELVKRTLHPYELFSYSHSPLGQWVLDLPSEDKLSWLLPTTMGWSW